MAPVVALVSERQPGDLCKVEVLAVEYAGVPGLPVLQVGAPGHLVAATVLSDRDVGVWHKLEKQRTNQAQQVTPTNRVNRLAPSR